MTKPSILTLVTTWVLALPAWSVAGIPDCNTNGIHDLIDIAAGTSSNCNGNAIPDECESDGDDCDGDTVLDSCEIAAGSAADCNGNNVLDVCDVAEGTASDCEPNGVVDSCERPTPFDCNLNGVDDVCDIAAGVSNDHDQNGLPDECGVESCTAIWDGFENDPFVPVIALNGLDSDTNGDAWSTTLANAQVITGGCPSGVSTVAIQNIGDDSNPVSGIVNSELFSGSPGMLPPPTTLVRIRFDYQLSGSLDARYDHRLFFVSGDTGQISTLLWFGATSSDFGVNEPGAGDDATPGQLWALDGSATLVDTGVPLDLGVCHHVEILFNTGAGAININVDGQPVFAGAAITSTSRIDRVGMSAVRHTSASPGGPDLFLTLDNFERCLAGAAVSCDLYNSIDCDGNNICDVFEAHRDADTDGVLDVCENYCDDCNHNGIRDSVEIALGSAFDADANGIIDHCQALTPAESFESFGVAPIDDQRGWSELGDTASFVADASSTGLNPVFPTDQSTFLIVADDPQIQFDSASFLLGPRSEALGEADIEQWCWDMFVTSGNFGSLYVEITDLCREIDGSSFLSDGSLNLGAITAAANTGLEFRGSAGALPNNVVSMLSNAGGGPDYGVTSAGDQSSIFGTVARTACIKIRNNFGQTEAVYGPVGLPPDQLQLIAVGQVETGKPQTLPSGAQQAGGGDRQWIIRTDGVDNGTQFWFDNLRYAAYEDCDNDGIRDSIYVDSMPQADADGDGTLDACQDCDNDCGGFPVADPSCLDAQEIATCAGDPACGDCNGNGIPDGCDVDPSLPFEGVLSLPGGVCPSHPECFVSRRGGGSCDADTNGMPDECQIAAGSATDCDNNGCADAGEIAAGSAMDTDGNNLPDECDPDCNHNGAVDALDIAGGTSSDADFDQVPDECCPSVPGPDFDADLDVDNLDYQRMQQCAGPVARLTDVQGGAQFIECGCADLDADGVVDDNDVRLFQQSTTGP